MAVTEPTSITKGEASPSTSPSEAEPNRLPLGVLFVHGIGSQKRGDTLLQFGEPLRRWLDEWLGGSLRQSFEESSSVTVSETTLRRADIDAPAHTTLDMHVRRSDGSRTGSRWLLAESWWAEDFPTPSFPSIALWCLSVGPWMVQRHFNLRFVGAASIFEGLKEEQRAVRTLVAVHVPPSPYNMVRQLWTLAAPVLPYVLVIVRRLTASVLSFLVGIIAQLLIASLVVFGIVPAFRSVVMWIQRAISQSIGDSYALVAQPLVFDAMISRVQSDLEWLSHRCSRIAVVAHSQGAAIAHEALRRGHHDEVSLLLTFGAGIVKLRLLRQLPLGRAALSFGLRLGAVASLTIGLLLFDRQPMLCAGLTVIALLLLIASVVVRPDPDPTRAPDELRIPRLGHPNGLRWIDLYASADPVTEGSLARPPSVGLTSQRIYNRRSTFSDHSTYWDNTEGFVSRVCAELAREAEWTQYKDLTADDGRATFAAEEARDARTEYLMLARGTAIVSVAMASLGLGWSYLRTVAQTMARTAASVPGLLTESRERTVSQFAEHAVGGAAIGCVAVALAMTSLYGLLLLPALKSWDNRSRETLVHRSMTYKQAPVLARISLTLLILTWSPLVWSRLAVFSIPVWVVAAFLAFLVLVVAWVPSEGPLQAAASLYVCDRMTLAKKYDVVLSRPRSIHTKYLGLAAQSDAVWICCGPAGAVLRVDLTSGVEEEICLGERPKAVDISDRSVWVTTDEALVRIQMSSRSVLARYQLEPGLEGVAAGAAGVWVAATRSSVVLRLDPTSGQVAAVIPVAKEPTGVSVHDGSVWVLSFGSGILTRIDPLINEGVDEIDLRAVPFGRPVATTDAMWIYDLQGALLRVDLASHAVTRVDLTSHAVTRAIGFTNPMIGGIAACHNTVWLVDGWKPQVSEVINGTRTREIRLPRRAQEIAVTEHWLCVATYE